MPVYAHTKKESPESEWELLYGQNGHAERTAAKIFRWAGVFQKRLPDAETWLRTLALYHDMGKASEAFQRYLRGYSSSVDHKTSAAYYFHKQSIVGKLMAYAFAGHHSGLPDGCRLFDGVMSGYEMPAGVIESLPENMKQEVILQNPLLKDIDNIDDLGVALTLLVRMLHSCLIDADWLATEEYMNPEQARSRGIEVFDSIQTLSERLEQFISIYEQGAKGYVNDMRRQIHERCFSAAVNPPGINRLNVPTGGGKTLSSLSYALRHAVENKLKRVIYVIPFTSIIEQTAKVFRDALGKQNVVEHHSALSEEIDTERNMYAAENWDSPVVVTTMVQFFESLYSSRNARCRKIHNIAQSVIVLDEVQSLPPSLLSPCLSVLKELQRGYGCSILLCTATQPTFENDDYFSIGWNAGEVRSLLGIAFEKELSEKMKRVQVKRLGTMNKKELVEHYCRQGQGAALFIVNLTKQAHELYQELASVVQHENLYHLSARMCPAHRQKVIDEVRDRLSAGLPVVLVSTRVIEAGVDVSFPVVYRDRCGLDSLAQSAGRCNRHGESPIGTVYEYYAFEKEYALPASFVDLRNAVYAMQDVTMGQDTVDIFSSDLVEKYFRLFYDKREGGKRWDRTEVVDLCKRGIQGMRWDFPLMAERFQMIENNQRSLFVPYGAEAEELRALLLKLQACDVMPDLRVYRKLQRLSVSVYDTDWAHYATECVHEGAGIYMLAESSVYDNAMGLISIKTQPEYIF